MVAVLEKKNPAEDLDPIAGHTANIEFGETAHMVKGDAIMSKDRFLMNNYSETARFKDMQLTIQVNSNVILSRGTLTVNLNFVLFVPDAAHNFVSVSGLCDYDHTALFMKTGCVIKKRSPVASISILNREMFALKQHTDNEHGDYMPDVRHAKLFTKTIVPLSGRRKKVLFRTWTWQISIFLQIYLHAFRGRLRIRWWNCTLMGRRDLGSGSYGWGWNELFVAQRREGLW